MDYKRDLYHPAIDGTINLLDAALRFAQVQRVAVTSSSASLFPPTPEFTRPAAHVVLGMSFYVSYVTESSLNPPLPS